MSNAANWHPLCSKSTKCTRSEIRRRTTIIPERRGPKKCEQIRDESAEGVPSKTLSPNPVMDRTRIKKHKTPVYKQTRVM